MRRFAAALAASCLFSHAAMAKSPASEGSQPPPVGIDLSLLIAARAVWDIVARPDNPLWPGWDASDTPILIYRPGEVELLINHPDPPPDFVPYQSLFADRFESIMIRRGKTEIEWDGQNTSREVFGHETLILADTLSNRKNWLRGWAADPRDPHEKFETLEYGALTTNVYEQLAMVVHEAFHVFQMRQLGDKAADERSVRVYPCLSVENNVAVALESIALEKAVRATTREVARRHGLEWLALRIARREELPQGAIAYEDANEFIEGVAKYVEVAFMREFEGSDVPDEVRYQQTFGGVDDLDWFEQYRLRQMIETMQGRVNVNNDPYGTSPVRGRLYFSGMGIALLLDALSPSWKREIARDGATLTSLAVEALDAAPQELAAAYERARRTPELEILYEEKRRLAEEGEADTAAMLASIRAGEDTLVEIDWSALDSERLGLSFTAFGVRAVAEDQTIYTLVPISAQMASADYVFEQSTPTPTFEDRTRKIFQFPVNGTIDRGWLEAQFGASDEASWIVEDLDVDLFGTTIQAARSRVSWEGGALRFEFLVVER